MFRIWKFPRRCLVPSFDPYLGARNRVSVSKFASVRCRCQSIWKGRPKELHDTKTLIHRARDKVILLDHLADNKLGLQEPGRVAVVVGQEMSAIMNILNDRLDDPPLSLPARRWFISIGEPAVAAAFLAPRHPAPNLQLVVFAVELTGETAQPGKHCVRKSFVDHPLGENRRFFPGRQRRAPAFPVSAGGGSCKANAVAPQMYDADKSSSVAD